MYHSRHRSNTIPTVLAMCLACMLYSHSHAAERQRLADKTLVVWAKPANLEQRASGTLAVLEADTFDTIVLGEVLPGVWMPGSDHFNRTETNQAKWPRDSAPEMVCVAIVYEGHTVRIYRNASLSAEYKIEAPHVFAAGMHFALGIRHPNRGFFAGEIEEARVYAKALTAKQIAALAPAPSPDLDAQAGKPLALWSFEDGTPREEMGFVKNLTPQNGAHVKNGRLVLDGVDDFLGKKIDYTSRVSRRDRYAETLAEQTEQLRDDPQILRFAESRRRMADDRYRPIFHYVNPEARLNDPNGLCFWQGRWHLFYQAYLPEDSRQHWGHAVSDDLIHWHDLPLAIYPNPEEKCYSGSALVDGDRVIAMYHGVKAGTMAAVSSDPLLLNWKKVTGGPVIPYAKAGEDPLPYNIFDPCIWKHEGMYYALTAGSAYTGPGGKRIRAEFLHRSKDLASWEYLHPFLEDDQYGLIGDDGACPYFWPIGDRHILLHFSHLSGGKYLLGDYDTQRHKFVVTAAGDFNFGPYGPCGVHAPSATPDGKGGVIVIFNMNSGKPMKGWSGIMTLPRRLTLVDDEDLRVEPAGDIESLRGKHRRIEGVAIPANREIVIDNIQGNAMEIVADIDLGGASMVEMNVLRSPGKEEFTRIAFFKNRGYRDRIKHGRGSQSLIAVDSSYASTAADVVCRAPEIAPVYLGSDKLLKLRVFVDRSVVEVFVNGKQCVALRVYPEREDSLGISFRAQGKAATLKSIDAWQMENIFEAKK
ncbi:MAG: GH32 C-terminal domain-containing protein [Planctomycetota bacterium]|nr:GH32 C-terminal domain-containing protein [Planctomycetota bacterium]